MPNSAHRLNPLLRISGMNEVYSLCALIVSSISFLINAYLLLIYFHCPLKKVEWCKYFFLLAGIQDIILSLTIILAIPIPVAGEFSVVFLATGPIHSPGSGEALLDLYCMMFITSWLLTANSFFFRYLQVCRRDLFQRCLSKTSVAVVIAVNIALLTQWAAAVHVAFYPTSEFIAANAHMVDMWTGLNSSECAQLGYSRKYSPSVVTNILIFIVSIYMAAVESLAVYSAIKIAKTLRQSTYSACLRKRHWQIFTLLLLQAACPFLLIYTPSFIYLSYLFTGWSASAAVSYSVGFLLCSFPLVNPIIIIAFLTEYRRHTLSILQCRKKIFLPPVAFVKEAKTFSVCQHSIVPRQRTK